MIAKDSIFREYDIRGIAGKDFDAGFARALGAVFARAILSSKFAACPPQPSIAVGHDCRASADELTNALVEGIVSEGVDVLHCGMGPTPQIYFMVYSQNLAAGIQVTASHNPGDQNGFKMTAGKNAIYGAGIKYLRDEARAYSGAKAARRGEIRHVDARELYTEDLIQRSRPMMGKRKVKVVVDGGNGVGGLVGPQVLRGLGCEVIELYTEPDGSFPNHHPDPTVLENLKDLSAKVLSEKADIGFAWDGDADRLGVVDETGKPIFGDMLLVILGRELLKEVPHPVVIADVKCSHHMFNDLAKRGAKPVMWKTGHSLIKTKMRELDGHLAGEMSGHLYFANRYFGFDDAIHGAARIVEILSNTEGNLASLLEGIPKSYSTPELRLDCPDDMKFRIAEGAKALFPEYEIATVDGVRVTFPRGWALVRASNTQPALILRFEADSEELLAEYRGLFEERLNKLRESLAAGAARPNL